MSAALPMVAVGAMFLLAVFVFVLISGTVKILR